VTIPCETVLSYLAAHLDGESTPLGAKSIEQHLAGCKRCRHAAADFLAYRRAVADAYRPEPAPEELRQAIDGAVRKRLRWRARGFMAAAILLVFCSGAALGLFAWRDIDSRRSGLGQVAARHHDAFVRGATPLDISTSDAARLVAWFKGRVPFALDVPDAAGAGVQLVGARLVPVGDGFGAFLVYRQGEAQVSLAVAAARDAGSPQGAESERFRSLRFHFSRLRGHNVISWNDRQLSYALVSDLPAQGRASCAVCHAPGSGLRSVEGFKR
jgi:anti-sigma factor RsiW